MNIVDRLEPYKMLNFDGLRRKKFEKGELAFATFALESREKNDKFQQIRGTCFPAQARLYGTYKDSLIQKRLFYNSSFENINKKSRFIGIKSSENDICPMLSDRKGK